jgi:hypothetical protein
MEKNADAEPVRQEHGYVTWSAKLFGCFAHPLVCCYVCACPSCAISVNSASLDGHSTLGCVPCCYPGTPCKNRKQALATFGYAEANCTTCLVTCCCWQCSECQIYRETLKYEGAPSQVLVRNHGLHRKQLVDGRVPGITLDHAHPKHKDVQAMYAPGRLQME